MNLLNSRGNKTSTLLFLMMQILEYCNIHAKPLQGCSSEWYSDFLTEKINNCKYISYGVREYYNFRSVSFI